MVSTPSFGFGLPARISQAQFGVQQGNEELLGLANTARPDMTPTEIYGLNKQEKQIQFGRIQDSINSEYLHAWHEANEERKKKFPRFVAFA